MARNTRELAVERPDGWDRKRWPYSGSLERRRAVVHLCCFTLADDGLPVGIRRAARRTGVPRSTIQHWVEWELKPLGLLEDWRALAPIMARRRRKL